MDAYHLAVLADPLATTTQVFYGNTTATRTGWTAWSKPRGCRLVTMVLIGNGAIGSDVLVQIGTDELGSPIYETQYYYGASSPITRLVIPAIFLPDTLYVSVPHQHAATALASYVSVSQSTSQEYLVATSGGIASTSTGGAAMAASDVLFASLGAWSSTAGQDAPLGVAPEVTWGATGLPISAGAATITGTRKITPVSTTSSHFRSLRPFVGVGAPGTNCNSAPGSGGYFRGGPGCVIIAAK